MENITFSTWLGRHIYNISYGVCYGIIQDEARNSERQRE